MAQCTPRFSDLGAARPALVGDRCELLGHPRPGPAGPCLGPETADTRDAGQGTTYLTTGISHVIGPVVLNPGPGRYSKLPTQRFVLLGAIKRTTTSFSLPPCGLSARQFLRLLGVEVKATEFQAVIHPCSTHKAINANPVAPYSNGASGAEPNHPDALL